MFTNEVMIITILLIVLILESTGLFLVFRHLKKLVKRNKLDILKNCSGIQINKNTIRHHTHDIDEC